MAGIIPLLVAVALTTAAPQPPRAHTDAPVLCVKEDDCPQPGASPPAARPATSIEALTS